MGEFLPGYEASGWLGIGAPKDTPAAIIEKLNGATNAVITEPGIKARLITMGLEPTPMAPAQFGEFIAAETKKWAKVVSFAHIKPE
jgi:tripartite-type tricarboxylate transporter receptor subunit TctC